MHCAHVNALHKHTAPRDTEVLEGSPPAEFKRALEGRTVVKVRYDLGGAV